LRRRRCLRIDGADGRNRGPVDSRQEPVGAPRLLDHERPNVLQPETCGAGEVIDWLVPRVLPTRLLDVLGRCGGTFLPQEGQHNLPLADHEWLSDGSDRSECAGGDRFYLANHPQRGRTVLVSLSETPFTNELHLPEQFTADEKST